MNRFAPFEIIAAARFMREGLVQTILIILGVALGVSVVVFMSALLAALQTNLFRRALNVQAQIVILPAPRKKSRARCARVTEKRPLRLCNRDRRDCARSTRGRRCAQTWSGSPR